MLSSPLFSFLFCLVFASSVAAHLDWVKALPDCWEKCFKATSDGCNSQSCICDASQSSSFLSSAISCIQSSCDAAAWRINSGLLAPADAYCDHTGNSIPSKILSSAYAQAKATSSALPLSTEKSQGYGDLKSTVTTTVTKTTTDKDGNTLEIIIPIVMGPKTTSTGKIVTSTLDSGATATATEIPSSATASPSPTAAPAATSTQAQEAASSTSSQAAEPPASGNGSPFENMQAGAGRWSVSGALVGMGLLAGVFMRM